MYIQSFIKVVKYFGKGKIFKLIIFSIMALIAGCLEFVGIALIYPLVLLLVNSGSSTSYLEKLPHALQGVSPLLIALLFGLCAMLLFISKNLYMVFFLYVQSKFIGNWIYRLENMIMDFYINAPYNSIQKIASADKIYIISALVPEVINGFVSRILILCTNIIILACIISLVLYKFFVAGIITILFAGICLLFQNKVFRAKINEIANKILPVSKQLNTVLYSIIESIKEVKILGVEKEFGTKYKQHARKLLNLQVNQTFLNSISPYIVETFVVFSIIILATVIVIRNSGQEDILVASFAVIVASIFRISPALNRIQSSIINLPATYSYTNDLIDFYEKYKFEYFEYPETKENITINFENKIEFKNINFSYKENTPILKNISFTINKGDFIGIIGLSGAGKTTLADILTGLLPADSGEILVDGITLNRDNFRAFRKNIGYVPQESIILDCSFRENIAWGIDSENIDDQRVIKLLKDVKLWDLVSSYKEGIYAEPIEGESGLSVGQNQRLAIARVLYRDPSILLLDEATSALDVKTESEITEILKEIDKNKTIIAIAHRLSTLQACNKLIYLENGEIVDIGSFKTLSDKYPNFAELVRLSRIDAAQKD